MWLLPALSRISEVAGRLYYRLTVAGGSVPPDGPVLIVANHPNSLLDPAMVAIAARRPIRFLAKAPLFTHPLVGWLVRGAGSIPVYRASDDPTQVSRNADSFRAVYDAIASGSAVGLFPEGISHTMPALAPLKTGAARMALGAAAAMGHSFPIVPVGLVFRDRGIFRSRALILVGERVDWDDLAESGSTGPAIVRELTARIDAALRTVTLNLESWEDAPLIECAEAVLAAELNASRQPADQIARLSEAAGVLARLRSSDDPRWQPLAADVNRHRLMLLDAGLTPASLHNSPRASTALRWTVGRLPLAVILASGISLLGTAIFWVPYRVSGMIATRLAPEEDTRSTYKLLGGALIFLLWIAILAIGTGMFVGWGAGFVAALVLPIFAVVTMDVTERAQRARVEMRRFFALRKRGALLEEMRSSQRDLAQRLLALRKGGGGGTLPPPPPGGAAAAPHSIANS
jgi:glycerol-3-phosphate O-acyltransferase / dihydroxyacetone phosphate acyltransferase